MIWLYVGVLAGIAAMEFLIIILLAISSLYIRNKAGHGSREIFAFSNNAYRRHGEGDGE
jgi:hypothetical protein